jgi:hypothetical protein
MSRDAEIRCSVIVAMVLTFVSSLAVAAGPDVVIEAPRVELLESTSAQTVLRVTFPVASMAASWDRAGEIEWRGLPTETEDVRTRVRQPIPPEFTRLVAVPDLTTPRWRVAGIDWYRAPAAADPAVVSMTSPQVYRGVPLAGLVIAPTAGDGVLAGIVIQIDHPSGDRGKALADVEPSDRIAAEVVPAGIVNPVAYRQWRQFGADRVESAGKATFTDPFHLTGNWLRIELDETGIYRLTGAELEGAGLVLADIDPGKVRLMRGGGLVLGDDPVLVESEQQDRTGLTEIAVELLGMGDGEWNVDDELRFYGFGTDVWTDRLDPTADRLDRFEHPHAAHGVYWLTWEDDTTASPFTGAALRMSTDQAAPSGTTPTTSHLARYHGEESGAYVGGWLEDFWAWDGAILSQFTREFELEGVRPGSSAQFWMEVSGLYTNQFGSRFEVLGYFNNDVAGAVAREWAHSDWSAEEGIRFGGTTTALVPGTNRVQLRYDNYQELNAFVAFDSFQLEYDGSLVKADYDNELACVFWGDDVTAPGTPLDVAFTLPPTGAHEVWEVTDPTAARRLLGEETGGASRMLTVGLSQDPGEDRHLVLFSAADVRPVLSVARQTVEPLRHSVAAADYIVIHPADFELAASELANLRSRVLPGVGSPNAVAVAVEDIYANFSGGQKDWRAIRQFLRHQFLTHGQRLRWVCLLGDASFDFRNYYGREPGVELFDWIPTDLISSFPRVPYPTSIYEPYTADESLVALDSPPIGSPYHDIPDLAIGRLPARSANDALALVQRVARYVEDAPTGAWRNRVLMSADDLRYRSVEPSANEEDHTIQAERLSTLYVPPSIEVQKLYLIEYPLIGVYKPDGRRDLLNWLNEGTTIFYYVGHGAAATLADEHLFEITDISGLTNGDRRFVFMAFSCDVGVYADPNSQCMAEDFVTASQGGGIASIAASWVSYSSLNDLLSSAVFSHYFPRQSVSDSTSVGEALTAGKAEMWPVFSRVRNARRYNVIGDPAIMPPNPVDDVGFAAGSADSLLTGRLHTVEPDLTGTGIAFGPSTRYSIRAEESKVIRTFVDYRDIVHEYRSMPQPVFRGQGVLDEPGDTIVFLAPQSMRTGDEGRLRVIVDDGSDRGHSGSIPVPVVQVSASSGGDVSGPEINLAFENNRVRVEAGTEMHATLSDTNGVNILATNPANSVLLEFDRSGIYNNVSGDVEFESGSYTRARLTTQLPGDLDIGEHIVVMTASDMFGNVGSDTLSFTLEAAGVGAMRDATVFPNPTVGPCRLVCDLSGPMSLQWDIYTVSGRRIKRVEDTFESAGPAIMEWDGRDGEGDSIANGVYLYVLRGRMPGDDHEIRETGQLVIMR